MMPIYEIFEKCFRRARRLRNRGWILSRRIECAIRGVWPNPYRIYRVKPESVAFFQTGDLSKSIYTYSGRGAFDKFKPLVLGGDWDDEVTPISETVVYRGMHERFVECKPWEETVVHPDNWSEPHPNIGQRYRNRSLEEFSTIAKSRECLFKSLAEKGCLSQTEINGKFWDELTINIGSDGRLIRNSGGQHRLILARLLGLPSIPIRVLVVHAEWDRKRSGAFLD
jgi:hypothetical protein